MGVLGGAAEAASPSPGASPTAPVPTATATPAIGATVTRLGPSATPPIASASPTPRRAAASSAGSDVAEPPSSGATDADRGLGSAAGSPPAAPPVAAQPRAYRTPERAAPPAFVAPEGNVGGEPESGADGRGSAVGAPPVMAPRPGARAGSAAVVFRVSARTAVEGFDLRIGYPRTSGAFGSAARPAECSAGTGMLIAANDRGDGEMRLLVASAQALPFPIDVFCRFTTEGGVSVGAADFAVRVAEVTSDGKRADPGLLLVSVVVR